MALLNGRPEELDTLGPLLQGGSQDPSPARQPSTMSPEDRALKAERVAKVGGTSKAWNLLTSKSSVAPAIPATLEALHPAPADSEHRDLQPQPGLVRPGVGEPSRAACKRAFFAIPRGSAPGPSGLRIEHLLGLMDREGFLDALHGSLAKLATGRIHAGAKPFVYGALLTPLEKEGGGIRPIAVGEVLLRMAGSALAGDHAQQFAAFFQPNNQSVVWHARLGPTLSSTVSASPWPPTLIG